MLQFIGHTDSTVENEVALPSNDDDADEFTIGRDAGCTLVLNSTTAPRMISRRHATIKRVQPASAQEVMRGMSKQQQNKQSRMAAAAAAAVSSHQQSPRWILTDEKSMNGVFLNDIKISSSLLTHGDIITFGGLPQIQVGTLFAQPDAEFVYRFVDPQKQEKKEEKEEAEAEDDATLPMDLPLEDALPVVTTSAEPEEEVDKTQLHDNFAASEDEEVEPVVIPVEDEVLEPTQILPPEPEPQRRPRSKPKTQLSNEMIDVEPATQVVIITPPVNRPGAAIAATPTALPRTFTAAPTQILDAHSPSLQPMSLTLSNGGIGSQKLAPPSPHGAPADPYATRNAAVHYSPSIDATMVDASLLAPLPTLDDPTIDGGAVPTLSSSIIHGMTGMGMLTQTQAIAPLEDESSLRSGLTMIAGNLGISSPAAAAAASVSSPRRPLPKLSPAPGSPDELYDAEDESPTPRHLSRVMVAPGSGSGVAAASARGVAASSSSASSSSTVSFKPAPPRGMKKRIRDIEEEKVIEEDDVGNETPNKKTKLIDGVAAPSTSHAPSNKFYTPPSSLAATAATVPAAAAAAASSSAASSSSTDTCPICNKLIDCSRLERHVNDCLQRSSEAESERVAKSMQEEENKNDAERRKKASAAAALASAAAYRPAAAASRPPPPSKYHRRRITSDDDEDEEAYMRNRAIEAGEYDPDEDPEMRSDDDDDDDDDEDEEGQDYMSDPEKDDAPGMCGFYVEHGYHLDHCPLKGRGGERRRRSKNTHPHARSSSYEKKKGPRSARIRKTMAAASSSLPAVAAAARPSSSSAAAAGPKAPCPLCSKEFAQSYLEEHADSCEGPDQPCVKCKKLFLPSSLPVHTRSCTGPGVMCPICMEDFPASVVVHHMSKCVGKDGRECELCKCLFTPSEIKEHEIECKKREAEMSLDEKMAIEYQRSEQKNELCNDVQLAAIQYVATQAKRLHEGDYKRLLGRYKGFGLGERELKQTLRYIRTQAPIIIHVNLTNCMKFFVADTHYRNQFETGTSCGTLSASARTGWEDGLFNRIYHRSDGYERVKYGVANIVNDPNGVLACRGYGDSFLVLKNETVRLRTSFASRDTGGGTARLASCEWYGHILNEYSDPELKDVISVATGQKLCVSSARISSYKECQFHGPIEFARDIDALVVNSRHLSDPRMMEMVEQFRKQNSINVIHMEADDASH